MRSFFKCLVLVWLSTTTILWGQEHFEIVGYVLDQETGDPVPYASVGVPEQHRGISANMNGFFRLLLPDNNQDHHLQISSIGYRPMTVSFSDIIWGQEQSFQLTPEPTLLKEVVITGKYQTLEQLVKSVSRKRKIYLRSTPYLMNGFYREVLKLDGEYQGLTEAQGILYLNGYNSGYKNNRHPMTYDLVQWKHIRRTNYPEPQYLNIATLLRTKDYYLHDGPLHKKNLDRLSFSVSDSTTYQDRLVLEISFEPKEEHAGSIQYRGRMYVKEDDQALLSLNIVANGSEPFLNDIEDQQEIISAFEISFSKFEGQYYLNHTSLSRSHSSGNKDVNWSTELIGTSFSNQQAMFLNYNQRVVLYSEMLNPTVNYDPSFWDDFSFSNGVDFKKMSDENPDLEDQLRNTMNFRLLPLPDGFDTYEQMANDRNVLDFLMQR